MLFLSRPMYRKCRWLVIIKNQPMFKSISRILLPVMIMSLSSKLFAQKNQAFDRGSFVLKGDTLPYRILFPLDFNPSKQYPLILVLHGAGERGKNNEDQLKYGPKLFLNDSIRDKYPAIV